MARMVITSNKKLEIGRIHRVLKYPWGGISSEQRFWVVREATRGEFIEHLVSTGQNREWVELLSALEPYFYEIETD